ncbi:MAG: RluA family pseudouridine synthase [Thermoanaerobaculia bacterium]
MRLDLALARRYGLPRRKARDAVRAGRVDVRGETMDEPGRDVSEDAPLAYFPDRPARRRVRTRLVVLAEGEDFVVVDKPAGLLTVPTAEREKETLLSRTLDYLHHRYRRRPYAGTVQRLDKETSGALVFARNRPGQADLQRQFRDHTIVREYYTIVEGDLEGSGTFRAELSRDPDGRRRTVARAADGGRRAVTHYEVVERFGEATLVAVRLETGRTHQIRIHFAAAGHPVLGDAVYRPPRMGPPPVQAPRQMLHARLLGFDDPETGRKVEATSPLPEDFRETLARLRQAGRRKKKEPRKVRGS